MCNYVLKSGSGGRTKSRLCLIKHKKNDFCHIHFNIQANDEVARKRVAEQGVKNQTKLIKSNQYLKQEIKNLNNTISLQVKKIEAMKEDYNNYQIIKQYEKEKNELINKGIDIYNYYNDDFHEKRYQRNVLAHAY